MASFIKSLNCASGKNGRRQPQQQQQQNSQHQSSTTISNNGEVQPSAPPLHTNNRSTSSHSGSSSSGGGGDGDAESFWEPGNFKVALKRCDNGHKLGDELADMITERAKLEEQYVKSLRAWYKKWDEHLRSRESSEYESTKSGWLTFVRLGEQTAAVHAGMAKELHEKPVQKIKRWLKHNYTKNFINFKQTKEFEAEFALASRHWIEHWEKLKKCKRDYNEAGHARRAADDECAKAAPSTKLSQEHKAKLAEKAKRAREQQEACANAYKDQLDQLELLKPMYVEKMREVYAKTDAFEMERMMFFKQTFAECRQVLEQVYVDGAFGPIFADYSARIDKLDPSADCQWWSKRYGVDTKPNWPLFEEYSDK